MLHSRNRVADYLKEIELGDTTRLMGLTLRDSIPRDSSLLLLPTVFSLPCEASTEAQTSDLELTHNSVDRIY